MFLLCSRRAREVIDKSYSLSRCPCSSAKELIRLHGHERLGYRENCWTARWSWRVPEPVSSHYALIGVLAAAIAPTLLYRRCDFPTGQPPTRFPLAGIPGTARLRFR